MASRLRSLAASSILAPPAARRRGAFDVRPALGGALAVAIVLTFCAATSARGADALGLDGPGIAPLDHAAFSARDLRADAPPLFAIEPDGLDAAIFHAADLGAASPSEGQIRTPAALFSPVAAPTILAALAGDAASRPFILPSAPSAPDWVVAPVTESGSPAVASEPPRELTRSPAVAAPVLSKDEPSEPKATADDSTAGEPVAVAPKALLRAALDARVADPSLRGRAGLALRKAREELAQVYATRGDEPFWIVGGRWTAAARGAFERLRRADEDGLNLGAAGLAALGDPTVETEIRLSEAVVAYARQAAGGRVEPWRVSALITAKPPQVAAQAALARVSVAAAAEEAGRELRDFNPPHPGYLALRDKLAEMRREQPKEAQPRIPLGPTLKVGMRDARAPLIRSRLGLGPQDSGAPGDPLIYDLRVASAVKDFQRDNGLPASGHLTPRTVAALSGGEPSRLEREILANMERWRWLPRDLGAAHIEVNIPDYALTLKEGERTTLTTRVVVGKPDSPTPVFSDLMRYLVVNPSWTMPPSILEKEAMPNLAADPDYYARRGYEVQWRNGKPSVRQPPGERNALGHVKFMFPNDHAVYLHDTPSRGLFAQTRRAYSHGCVRVDQPFRLAEAVLGGRFSEGALKKMVGARERTIHLSEPLPIHLTYFTAKVDEDGRLSLTDDIYGYSQRLRAAMGLEGGPSDSTAALRSAPQGGSDDRTLLLADPERAQNHAVSGRSRPRLRDQAGEHRGGRPVQARLSENRAEQPDAGDRGSGPFGWWRADPGVRVGRDPALSQR